MGSSTAEQLEKCNARIFVAQGTKDRAASVSAFDMLVAHLISKGKDVQVRRVEGADHSFADAEKPGNGWSRIHTAVRDWFLEPRTADAPANSPLP